VKSQLANGGEINSIAELAGGGICRAQAEKCTEMLANLQPMVESNIMAMTADVCTSSSRMRGQGKHGFAAHRRGVRSWTCCGESPRAYGQRVSAGDRKALAMVLAVRLHAEPWCRLGPVAAAKACRERLLEAPTERGSLSSCPLMCLMRTLE